MGSINTQLTIREAAQRDLDTVVDLWEELISFHHDLDNRHWVRAEDGDGKFRDWTAESLEKHDRLLLVGEVQQTVVGFIHGLLQSAPPPLASRLGGFITDLVVADGFRRCGVASRLVTAAEQWLKDQGAEQVTANVAVRNQISASFWGKQGFETWTQTMWKALS